MHLTPLRCTRVVRRLNSQLFALLSPCNTQKMRIYSVLSPYLGGLDERLAVPRRAEPRVRVEAGSVAIGGGQTGVISRTFPSGWHIIGRTETELFDVRRAQAALLSPGDRVHPWRL